MSNNFYVYRHIRLDINTPFYVGMGSGNRYNSKHNRNRYWQHIVNKFNYKVEIIKDNLTQKEACLLESKLISLYKQYNFAEANLAEGGLGGNTWKYLPEAYKIELKQAQSERNSGKNNPMYGKSAFINKSSVEMKQIGLKISQKLKNKKRLPHSRATCQKISQSRLGRFNGNKNPNFKYKCSINGVEFESIKEASVNYKVARDTIIYRCNSKKDRWDTWRLIYV